MNAYRAASFVAAVALFGATAAAAALSIDGRVTLAEGGGVAGGKGLAQASVELHAIRGRDAPAPKDGKEADSVAPSQPAASVRTGPQGYFRLVAPEQGMWRAVVKAEGHVAMEIALLPLLENADLPTLSLPARKAVRNHSGLGRWVEVSPTASVGVGDGQILTVPISGRVVDGASHRGVAGAYVWPRSDLSAFTRTDEHGRYTFTVSEESETIHLQAAARGYLPESREVAPSTTLHHGHTLALQPAAAVSGRVVDEAGRPLAKAEIQVSQTLTRSDLQGRFRLAPLVAARAVEITFSKPGFVPESEILAGLKPGETKTGLEVVLRQGRTVRGLVVDEQETPVVAAQATLSAGSATRFDKGLSLMAGGHRADLVAVTNSMGVFELANVPLESHDLKVESAGFMPVTIGGLEIPGGQGSLDLGTVVLSPGAAVSGRITDSRGEAVAEASVYVARSSRRPFPGPFGAAVATSAADGSFTVQDLALGARVDLQVRRPGFRAASLTGVKAPTADHLEIILEPASRVSGQVVDPYGEPVAAARVWIQPEAGARSIPPTPAPVHTDEEGLFSLAEVDPGRNLLNLSAEGFLATPPRVIEVPPEGAIDDLRIVLEKGEATIQGQILGPGDQPEASAQVRNAGVSTHTDGGGFYVLTGVATGPQTVTAVRSGGFSQVSRSLEVEPGVQTLDLRFGGHEVAGRVLNQDGAPIAGASVSLRGTSAGIAPSLASSSADGSFEVPGVADGLYRISATKEGFASSEPGREVRVDGAPVRALAIRLDVGSTVGGHLLGLDFDRLAQVIVTARTQHHLATGRVRYNGEYRIPNLAPGDWKIGAELAGRRIEERIYLEAGAEEVVLDLEFGNGLTLTGEVLSGGEPLTGARVSLFAEDQSAPRFVATSYRGEFHFEDLDPGPYHLSVAGHLEEVDVSSNREVLIDISTGELSGRVLDSNTSMPVSGVTVSLGVLEASDAAGISGRPGLPPASTTDAAGRFAWPRVPEGSYRVEATKEGYALAEDILEVGPGAVSVEMLITPAEELVLPKD